MKIQTIIQTIKTFIYTNNALSLATLVVVVTASAGLTYTAKTNNWFAPKESLMAHADEVNSTDSNTVSEEPSPTPTQEVIATATPEPTAEPTQTPKPTEKPKAPIATAKPTQVPQPTAAPVALKTINLPVLSETAGNFGVYASRFQYPSNWTATYSINPKCGGMGTPDQPMNCMQVTFNGPAGEKLEVAYTYCEAGYYFSFVGPQQLGTQDGGYITMSATPPSENYVSREIKSNASGVTHVYYAKGKGFVFMPYLKAYSKHPVMGARAYTINGSALSQDSQNKIDAILTSFRVVIK
jgi:hypothetical protein